MGDVLGGLIKYQSGLLQNQSQSLKNYAMGEEIAAYQQKRQREATEGTAQQQAAALLAHARETTPPPTPSVQDPLYADATHDMQEMLHEANIRMKAGQALSQTDPDAGYVLIKQATELRTKAQHTFKEWADTQQTQLKQAFGWAGSITSQEALDTIKPLLESAQPGIWQKLNLPTTYDATSAQRFRKISEGLQTRIQTLDATIKEAEVAIAKDYYKAKLEKAQADAVNAKSKVALGRDDLPTPKDIRSAAEKYHEQVSREEQQYATNLAKQRATILKDTKKYPDTVKDYSLLDKLAANITDTPLEQKLSPREQALAVVERVEAQAHKNRLIAIQKKAAALGIIVPEKKALRMSAPEAAVAYLREHDTPEMRQAFEAKYGYLPE